MLINESGLVRCIKRAYRSAGYAVVTQDDSMAIYTEQWYVQCKRAALPRKVLATIVEHMGHVHHKGRGSAADHAGCGHGRNFPLENR